MNKLARNKHSKHLLRSKRGNLSIDFLFGLTIVFASMAVFFSISFSLSIIELAQYFGYASARTFNAAHQSEEKQRERAQQKFASLYNQAQFKVLFKESGWFELKFAGAGNFAGQFPASGGDPRNLFVGTQLKFKASMLDMQLPLVGATSEEDGFESDINSFLGREPSFNECVENFYNKKEELLSGLGYSIPGGANDIKVMVDNGC